MSWMSAFPIFAIFFGIIVVPAGGQSVQPETALRTGYDDHTDYKASTEPWVYEGTGIAVDSVPMQSGEPEATLARFRSWRKHKRDNKNATMCSNHGTFENGRCRCRYPYTGSKCVDFACEHGLSVGARYDPESPIFNHKCICDDDWIGDLCNIPIADQCNERGQYIHGHCVCLDYYFGNRCQYVGKCDHGKLMEGACKCDYGWKGDYCNEIVCHHGYTTAELNHTSCICPPRHTGQFCDECANTGDNVLPFPNCTIEIVPYHARLSREKTDDQIVSRLTFIAIACCTLLVLMLVTWVLRWGRHRSSENGDSETGEERGSTSVAPEERRLLDWRLFVNPPPPKEVAISREDFFAT